MELLYEYNQTRPREQERRQALLRELLAEVGEGRKLNTSSASSGTAASSKRISSS